MSNNGDQDLGVHTTKQLANAAEFRRLVQRLARQIVTAEAGRLYELALVGIQRRGVTLAREIKAIILEETGHEPLSGILDITLYRDDLSTRSPNPEIHDTDIPFNVEGKIVVLVDDVLYTGRTARAAMDSVIEFGRPAGIRLAILVDRELRELPIRADFCGLSRPTTANQIVKVHVTEFDGDEGIYLLTKEEERP